MTPTDYQFNFTNDWISPYFPLWDRLLPRTDIDHILEVGCYEGRSSVWFMQRYPNAFITCIDTFTGGHDHRQAGISFTGVKDRFIHNMDPWDRSYQLYEGRSDVALPFYLTSGKRGSFDIVLVDGSHMAADVFTDIALSWPLLAAGGIMILDDYGWGGERLPHERPAPAIDAFFTCFANQYELLALGYQCIVRKLPTKL